MSFCFAHITNGKNDDLLKLGIQSIHEAGIDDYEILIIGDTKIFDDEVRVIGFDESIRPGWITRKKPRRKSIRQGDLGYHARLFCADTRMVKQPYCASIYE